MAEPAAQVAAIPMRWNEDGDLQILMVTSRDTGRWILPKGWEMDGKKPWRAAEIEALEEAGVRGRIGQKKIGTYEYDKRLDNGETVRCKVRIYPMIVTSVKSKWKERDDRRRRWFSPKSAARAVKERDLTRLLSALDRRPRRQPGIRKLLKSL